MKISNLCVCVCFLIFGQLQPNARAAAVPVKSKGETTLQSTLGKLKVEVKIRTHEVPNGTPANPVKPKDSACTMSRIPCSPVDAIKISVNKTPLFVPRSAFADLADLGTAELAVENGRNILVLEGGDASESYIVKIAFTSKSITRRTLVDAEFPDELLEETVYHLGRGTD